MVTLRVSGLTLYITRLRPLSAPWFEPRSENPRLFVADYDCSEMYVVRWPCQARGHATNLHVCMASRICVNVGQQ